MRLVRAPSSAALVGVLLAAVVPVAEARQPVHDLRTASERSGFTRHTSHDELMEYLAALGAATPEMRLSAFGETHQRRTLPYAIFARPAVASHQEAMLTGKPVLVLAANVHGGERTFRESLLILARRLATPGTELNFMLDDLVILIVPSLNPDGFEATARGTRGNAWGLDMNRDYVKLEQPEIAAFVGNVLNTWFPHVFIDGHNGGSYPYNLNYQCVSNAAADLRITALCDDEIFPFIDGRMEARGYRSWYYMSGTETRWNTGGSDVRIGRNYGGMANMVAILFESPTRQDLATGVDAGVVGYTAVIEFVHRNPGRVMDLVRDARQETVRLGEMAEGQIPVRMRYEPEPYQVTYDIAVGEDDDRRIITVVSDSLMKRPVPTLLRPRPYAYVIPRDAVDAVAMLRRHNISVEVLDAPLTVEVQAYVLADVEYREEYNHAAATVVEVGDVVTAPRDFPPGSYVVRTGQVLGRIVTHMLEPETSDNVILWNTMDAWLPKAALQRARLAADGADDAGEPEEPPLIPIFKIMEPTPLPARILE